MSRHATTDDVTVKKPTESYIVISIDGGGNWAISMDEIRKMCDTDFPVEIT